MRKIFASVVLALMVAACGEDAGTNPTPTPTPSYTNVAGTYSGVLVAATVFQGDNVYLNSVFTITLNQNGANLTGSAAAVGALTDDFGTSIPVLSSGSLTGSVSTGTNPTVTLTSTGAPSCPNYTQTDNFVFANGALSGQTYIDVLDVNCDVAIRFANIIVNLPRQ